MTTGGEWLDLFHASAQLVSLWNITKVIAEGIVRNAVQSGDVRVRGHDHYQLVPQLLTKTEIAGLQEFWPVSPRWSGLQVNQSDLLKHGRQLVPGWLDVAETELSAKMPEATDTLLEDAIKLAYTNAEKNGAKAPNIKELPAAVNPILEELGFRASGIRIQNVGGKFRHLRRKPGRTMYSERTHNNK